MTKNSSPHRDDRTIDLTLGLLSGDEEQETLEAIAANRSIEEELAELTAVRETIRGLAGPKPSSSSRDKMPGSIRQKRRFPFPQMLAAALLGVILIRVFLDGGTQGTIAPLQVPLETNRLRGANGVESDLSRGLAVYEAGDYETAAQLLSDSPAYGATETMRLIYLASAYNLVGRHDEAIEILETLPFETIPDPWGEEGLRNLLHALRETGQEGRADRLVEQYGPLD